jgi:transketolase
VSTEHVKGGKSDPLMRDAFIDTVFARAKKDKDIVFVSADFGAKALDAFRVELPGQFIHAGISEQHMVDFAAGLALSGRRVFLYAMAPFITLRCIEQIKCVLVSMNLPVTLIGVGVGLGYDHATLTHFTPEDVACMRAMNHLEVWSPADAEGALHIAELCLDDPRLRYVRLERQGMPSLYRGRFAARDGFLEVRRGTNVALVACGYMTHKALRAAEQLGEGTGVIDLFRIKPIDSQRLVDVLSRYERVVTVEEQLLQGGFGSAVLEVLSDRGIDRPVRRVGMRDGFDVVNGDRDHLHALYGIDVPDIIRAAAG